MVESQGAYSIGLDQNKANFVPLSPLSFLARSAAVYPDHTSTVYEGRRFTWAQTYQRCRRFASYLAARGIGRGDTVAAMLPNLPAMNEAHFAVPMAGAVLNALNIRLDPPRSRSNSTMAAQNPAGRSEFAAVITDALELMTQPKPVVIDVDDVAFGPSAGIGEIEYEDAVTSGDPTFTSPYPLDEWDAIALGYTSGTTGNPKGVVTHHRGAYLNAVSNILAAGLGQHPVYLWTLPMFHCNGWCFRGRWRLPPASTSACARSIRPKSSR